MAESLIFIPDISGFTEFINTTESKHSQHVVSELLETVINANEISLKVSEIEGDAILFYRNGPLPSLSEIFAQTRKMYLAFHHKLLHSENHRICPCGACKSAANLTLKFIVHTGEISEVTVSGHSKLHGATVITAHRLLKNNVQSNEYLLLSGFYANADESPGDFGEAEFVKASAEYDSIGKVPFIAAEIGHLRKEVPLAEKPKTYQPTKDPIRRMDHFEFKAATLFEALSNYEYRAKPYSHVKNIEYDRNRVTKAGSRHLCVFESGPPTEQEVVLGDFGPGKLVLGERMLKPPPMCKDAITFFVFDERDGGTDLSIEFHIRRIPIIGGLAYIMMKKPLQKILNKLLAEFREFITKNAAHFEARPDVTLQTGFDSARVRTPGSETMA